MKFRKKPVVIDAIQLTEDLFWKIHDENSHRLPTPFEELFFNSSYDPRERKIIRASVIIKTLEGDMRADLGDWIIKGVKGEFYPCRADIFELTYEEERKMKCKRCGAEEDRIHGYCSVRCEELHEVEQENERLLSENETLVNNIVKIGDIAQEQDEYVERLRGLLADARVYVYDENPKLGEKIKKALEEK